MRWFFILAREVCRVVCFLKFRVTYEGVENIPSPNRSRGYIIACNHISYFDPLLLAMRVKSVICYLAKGELFSGGLRVLFDWLCAIAVDRGAGDTGALETAAARIEEGLPVGIFPEGTRHKDGVPGRPKSGMALIAGMTNADVLPCAVIYREKRGFRREVTVRYGTLIGHETLGIDETAPRTLKRATKLIWNEILTLAEVQTDAEA